MTLPVALLIACYKHESISHEIRQIAYENNNMALMESLSCKCKDHINRLHLVPPSSCCSSERSSPISDLGSETSSNCCNSVKSYSYFSDGSDLENLMSGEGREDALGRCLSALVDLLENITVRFKESYVFKGDEIKIHYQKRDILDLGQNIQGTFPLKHPIGIEQEKALINQSNTMFFSKKCPISDCTFQDLLPYN